MNRERLLILVAVVLQSILITPRLFAQEKPREIVPHYGMRPLEGGDPGQAQQALQVLHKHVRPAVTSGRAAPVGFLPSTQRLNLIIHLPVRNQDELTSLIGRLSDPTSPDYRHWLSVAEFTERFGRTEVEYQKVADFAEANGFAVTYKSPNRLMFVVRGSVAQIEKAFNVKMRTYQHPSENRIFYSPDREPSLALDVPVSHISGLNNYSYPRPGAGPRAGNLGGNTCGGTQMAPGTGSGPYGSFLGSDMRAAYNMGSNTGTGQTVGLAEFSGYNPKGVSMYFSTIGQTNNVPIENIVVDGGSATDWTKPCDEGEVSLDIEQAVSVAPGLTQLRVYIGPESLGTGVDGYIFSQMATDDIAKQLSNSWYWYPDDPTTDDPYFEQMACQGQTFFNLSGDHGAYNGHLNEDEGFPAEDNHVTDVGGTELMTSGGGGPWESEVAWNDPPGGASGGGPADNDLPSFYIQSWQMPVINSSNMGSTTLRNSPDVAMQADYNNYICYDTGTPEESDVKCFDYWGGTSFAAPRWAAWLALVNQQVVTDGYTAGLGFINPTLYSIGQSSSYNSDFHDITSGNNEFNNQLPYYNAVAGYDLVTGWGSMNGLALMAVLDGSAAPNFSLSASPNSLTIPQGSNGTSTITVNPLDGFTGSVSLSASGLPSGVTAEFNPTSTMTTSVLTLTASATAQTGTATMTITGTSGSLSATATIMLTVTLPEQTIYSFCAQTNCTDGSQPYAGLVQGTDGKLYGTTVYGAASGAGTVFNITTNGTLKTFHSFNGVDGQNPLAGLVQDTNGDFYGSTVAGGANGYGTVFKITPSGTLKTLDSFTFADGFNPEAAFVPGTNGKLYGTTVNGGDSSCHDGYGCGTVFRITPSGTLTVLHTFDSANGQFLHAGLVQGTNGDFYGTAQQGGANNDGTVFRITPSGTLKTLYSFCSQSNCTDGYYPYGGLVQGTDGNFYGTTSYGGANNNDGTVFRITPSGTLTTLHSFDGTDGYYPNAALVEGTDGNFYGTTTYGGANNNDGTVFKITPSGTLTMLYSFCMQSGCTDGENPYAAALIQDTNGTFYGTTQYGGANGDGTIFSLSVGLGPFVETQPTSGDV
jgi:uncharacterized repeat protein (TIGR03803 family)